MGKRQYLLSELRGVCEFLCLEMMVEAWKHKQMIVACHHLLQDKEIADYLSTNTYAIKTETGNPVDSTPVSAFCTKKKHVYTATYT